MHEGIGTGVGIEWNRHGTQRVRGIAIPIPIPIPTTEGKPRVRAGWKPALPGPLPGPLLWATLVGVDPLWHAGPDMNIRKAVVTAAGRNQRTLPLQTLVDRDGAPKTALAVILEEVLGAGIETIAVIVHPGDKAAFATAAGPLAQHIRFIPQPEPRGYGHAVACAQEFTGSDPFLLLVGDHIYVSTDAQSCTRQLLDLASRERCAVSAVQATHESKLPHYGAVGGRRVHGHAGVYEIAEVLEKPTPTQAEQSLIVPGLRSGRYLCFFGMHVLTPLAMELLEESIKQSESTAKPGTPPPSLHLSAVLAQLARRERYLAYEVEGRRYDLGMKYGLLTAQLALGLAGNDRDEILTQLVDLLARQANGATH